MELTLLSLNGINIAELSGPGLQIRNLDDALDLIGNAGYQGASYVILQEEHLHPNFFDLKTKLAGEILQKFSTYSMKLFIIGDFSRYESKSLKDFIFESNKNAKINFVASINEAKEILSRTNKR